MNTRKVTDDIYDGPEFFVVGGTLVLFLLLIAEMIDWQKYFKLLFDSKPKNLPTFIYGYAEHNGPHKWKQYFPDASGKNQSPINIITRSAIAVNHCGHLKWSEEFFSIPDEMFMENDGHSVILHPRWLNGSNPTITGGPLEHCYQLEYIKFRWGSNDKRGSEHMIDGISYAMEMQIFFTRIHTKYNFELRESNSLQSEVIVSVFYKCTQRNNHLVEHIIKALQTIREPNTDCKLQPFPLIWLMKPFELNFYTYIGSLTNPPCTEGIIWIIYPEPIGIASRQIHKFRKLVGTDGYYQLSNYRPIQSMNNRELYYYE